MRSGFFSYALPACGLVLTLSGCGGNATVPQRQVASIHSLVPYSSARAALPKQALLGVNQATGTLEAWPIAHRGGHPIVLDGGFGVTDGIAMAADGNVIAVARYHADVVMEYNVATGRKTTLPDPFGEPDDVAIGSDHSIYVVNYGKFTGIVDYPQGHNSPRSLPCSLVKSPEYVAVDAVGNVFVNGYEGSASVVVEIPRTGSCRDLNLNPEAGYIAGLAYDPRSGDLLVMDDPGVCAGPPGARITIYPKPYTKNNARSFTFGGSCASGLRLNAHSTLMFFTTPTLDGGSNVFQAGFPAGKIAGSVYSGGDTGAITTIPNTLPN